MARTAQGARWIGRAAMTEGSTGWELGDDGQPISIPISPRDADDVRAWCSKVCRGDFIICLGRRVVFAKRDDAALATLFWGAEEP